MFCLGFHLHNAHEPLGIQSIREGLISFGGHKVCLILAEEHEAYILIVYY
jgi:hypothetical protein